MSAALFTIGASVMNPLAFSGANVLFSKRTDHGEKEQKRHDLALEKFQRARDKWNEDIMKRLDFINKMLRGKNEARVYINNVYVKQCLSTMEYLRNK